MFSQLGTFQAYDYENEYLNIKHYNLTKPPFYDLSRVTAPQVLFMSHSDVFAPIEVTIFSLQLFFEGISVSHIFSCFLFSVRRGSPKENEKSRFTCCT